MSEPSTHSVSEVECKTFEIRFEDFDELPAVKGRDRVDSPEFTCFGHQWRVRLYPGGDSTSNDGNVAVYLRHCSSGSIGVQATFAVAESKGKVAAYFALNARKYQAAGDKDSWGPINFAERSTIIGALENGALVIEVRMNQTGPSSSLTPFVPKNPSGKNTLKRFLDEETADIVFTVSSARVEEGGRRKRKRDKVPSTTFHAHRFVLLDNAPALAEACESSSALTPIPITGIEPDIFRHVLYYLYGGVVDNGVLKEKAKAIIDAADKFGVVGLKLEAEASLVGATTFTIDNTLEYLIYADAKNLPLLKEGAVDFLVEHADESKRLTFDDVPGHVIKDIMTAMARREEDSDSDSDDDDSDLSSARVDTLRKMLHEKGLDVDGSRETMLARLEEHSSE